MLETGPWWNASRAQAATVSVVVTRCAVQGHEHLPAARCPACEEANRGEVDHEAGVAAVREALAKAPATNRPP